MIEQINIRIDIDINDWLNGLVTFTRRRHGQKINKEVLVNSMLVFVKDCNLDWSLINSTNIQLELTQQIKKSLESTCENQTLGENI